MINKKYVAFILAVGFLLSIGCVMSQKQIRPDIGKPRLNDPKDIDLTTLFIEVPAGMRNASAGNSEGLYIEVRVRDNRRNKDIDHLNESNFEIQTLAIPPGAPGEYSMQIEPWSFRIVNTDCTEEDCIPNKITYGMGLIPRLAAGTRGTWVNGDHFILVKYLMGEYEDSSGSVFFRIGGNAS